MTCLFFSFSCCGFLLETCGLMLEAWFVDFLVNGQKGENSSPPFHSRKLLWGEEQKKVREQIWEPIFFPLEDDSVGRP